MNRITTRVAAFGAVVLAVGLSRLTRYEIADNSMRPTLHDGDWVIALKPPSTMRRGDVVVLEHPGQPGFNIVKRVAGVAGHHAGPRVIGDGELWVLGDDPSAGSVDSRTFGPVPTSAVLARVLARYKPMPPRFIR